MTNETKETTYTIFDNRYNVIIGSKGKVTITSNINYGKELKVYGKKKDNLRFVNLTALKGGSIESYRLSDLKAFVLCESDTIEPITEDNIISILNDTKPPLLLDDPSLIESLPCEKDNYNNIKFVEEINGYKRYYKKINFNNTSNGFLQFNYKVSSFCEESKVTTNSNTKVFTDYNTIIIKDLNNLDNDTRLHILELLKGCNSEE